MAVVGRFWPAFWTISWLISTLISIFNSSMVDKFVRFWWPMVMKAFVVDGHFVTH